MRKLLLLALLLSYFTFTGRAQTVVPSLGKAFPFTALAKTSVNSSGETKIYGNAGVTSVAFNGFPPGIVYGAKEVNTQVASDAHADLVTAYNQAAAMTPTQTLTGNLGGMVLRPGIYRFENDALLSGNLTLDNNGDPNAIFIFQVKGNLETDFGSNVNYKDGAAPRVKNIFWQVAGNTTLGSNSFFRGTILGQGIIYVAPSATIHGRLLTTNGSITLNTTKVTIPTDLEVTITKSAGNAQGNYYVGNTVTYTIVAKNNGPIDETGIRVTLLNSGLTYVSHNTVTGSYNKDASQWTIPALASGASVTLTVTATINNEAEANLVNSADIRGDGLDEVRENNVNAVTICVSPANPSDITGPAAVCVGSEQIYSITPIKVATQYNWSVPQGWTIIGNATGASIRVIVGATPGDVTVTAANTCSISEPRRKAVTTATGPSPAPEAITVSNGTNNPCVGTQNLTFSVPAISNALSYTWTLPSGWVITAGNNTNSITVTVGSGSGEVSVRAVNPCGPSEKSTITVSPSAAAPTAAATITGSSAPCSGETTTYSVSGETGATYFNWTLPSGWRITAGTGTNTITVEVGATAGSIAVSGVNGCGTSSTTSLAVIPTVKTTPSIIDGPLTPCASSTGEVYTYTVGAVQGATSYFWRVDGGLTIVEGQGTASIRIRVTSTVASGNIFVSALNTCGQSAEKSITIVPLNRPARPAEITGGSSMPCVGEENIKFSIAPVSGATSYAWTFPAGWVISGASDGTTVTVRAGSASGNVSVVAINSCGPGVARTMALTPTLTVPEKPLSLTGSTSLCVGNTDITYSVANSTDATGYIWEVPTGWTITAGQGTASIKVNPSNTSGAVRIMAKNNCGNSVASTLNVVVSSSPSPAPGFITTNPIAPCVNQQNVSFTVDEIAGASGYEWVVSEGWVITSGQGTSSIRVTIGNGPGTVSVKARNGCGLSDASNLTVEPATTPPATPVTVTGRTAVCANEANVTYTVTGMTNVTGYQWSINGGSDWSITSGQGTASIRVKAGANPADITVIAVNNCGQSSAKTIAVVTSTVAPSAPGAITGSTNLCAGNTNMQFTVAPVTGATSYIWTLPSGWTYTQNVAGNTISATVGSTSGKIRVRAVNGCGESTESELTVAPTTGTPPKPGNILAATSAVCETERGVSYIVPPVNGASSYNWVVPADWTITSGQGSTTITVTVGKTAGNISVTAVNNCGNSAASTLAVRPNVLPAKPISIAGESLPCRSSDGNTYVIPAMPGATTYLWTVPTGWTITSDNGTSITVQAGTSDGEITVKAGNECGYSEATVLQVATTANAPAKPLAITGNQVVCAGETEVEYMVESVPNTSSYNWTLPSGWEWISGQGTNRIKVKPSATAGNISVIAANGCGVSTASTLGVQVTGVIPAAPTVVTGPLAPCVRTTNVVYTVGAVSGATRYTWTVPAGWTITSPNGGTSITVTTGTEGGVISVTSGNGCGDNATAKTIAVTTISTPTKPQAIVGPANVCFNNVVTFSVPAIAGATGYVWDVPNSWPFIGQGTNSISVTVSNGNSGEISVIAQNTCGSSEATRLAVTTSSTASPAPGQITGNTNALICQNQPGLVYSVEPISTANSYKWELPQGWVITNGENTNTITVTSGPGSGNISVKAVNGCGESDASTLPVVVNNETPISLGAIYTPSILCGNQVGLQFSVAPVNGVESYEWAFDAASGWKITGGNGTTSITVTSSSKVAILTVRAKGKCTTGPATTISLFPTPTPTAPSAITQIGKCGLLEFSVKELGEYNWYVPEKWTIVSGHRTNRILVASPAGSPTGTVSVEAVIGTCSSSQVSIIANPAVAQAELNFSNALTPNSDRVNDTWKIKNIESYPENDLTIMNRWGSEVYRTKGYKNTWNGGELSEGTYFYVLNVKVCDGSVKTYKGYVMIIR